MYEKDLKKRLGGNPTNAQSCHAYSHAAQVSCNYQRSCLSGGHQKIQRERANAVEMQQEARYGMHGEKAQAEKAVETEAKQQSRNQKLTPGDVHLSPHLSLGKLPRIVPSVLQNLEQYLYGFQEDKYNHMSPPHPISLLPTERAIQKQQRQSCLGS